MTLSTMFYKFSPVARNVMLRFILEELLLCVHLHLELRSFQLVFLINIFCSR
jgi:hypothetical protein